MLLINSKNVIDWMSSNKPSTSNYKDLSYNQQEFVDHMLKLSNYNLYIGVFWGIYVTEKGYDNIPVGDWDEDPSGKRVMILKPLDPDNLKMLNCLDTEIMKQIIKKIGSKEATGGLYAYVRVRIGEKFFFVKSYCLSD